MISCFVVGVKSEESYDVGQMYEVTEFEVLHCACVLFLKAPASKKCSLNWFTSNMSE